MRLSLGAVASGLAVSNAILLPPSLQSTENDIMKALPIDTAAIVENRVIEVPCPGCIVTLTDMITGRVMAVTNSLENALKMNFSIAHGYGPDELLLNGIKLYPADPFSPTVEVLKADQMVKMDDGTWTYRGTPRLGYGLKVHHLESSANEKIGLLEIEVEVVEVAGLFMQGIPSVQMKVLETPSGKLMIADAQIVSAKPTSMGQECTTMICKFRAIMAAKLAKLKGCAGGRIPAVPTVAPVGKVGHGDHRRPHHGSRPHFGTHQGHRHHGRHGGFARFLRIVVSHVLMPLAIGFIVGFTASLVGMVVGHIAIFLWRVLFRRGQAPNSRKAETGKEESAGLMANQESPPRYEDSPIYEAVVDEKTTL